MSPSTSLECRDRSEELRSGLDVGPRPLLASTALSARAGRASCVDAEAMPLFLDRFSAMIAADEHVAMVLDQPGWHSAKALVVPTNISPVPLRPWPHREPRSRIGLGEQQKRPTQPPTPPPLAHYLETE